MRYEVRNDGKGLKVWDSKELCWITRSYETLEVAKEIAKDFNNMDKMASKNLNEQSRSHTK